MFYEVNVSYTIQRNAHKDILIFWHLPHYITATLFRGINNYNSSYSSHNKFSSYSKQLKTNALTVQNPHHKCDGETGTITDKKIIAKTMSLIIYTCTQYYCHWSCIHVHGTTCITRTQYYCHCTCTWYYLYNMYTVLLSLYMYMALHV